MTTPKVDAFTKRGAERLAKKITAYWADKGLIVKTRVERIKADGDGPVMDAENNDRPMSLTYQVRSDMVDGRPRALARKEAA